MNAAGLQNENHLNEMTICKSFSLSVSYKYEDFNELIASLLVSSLEEKVQSLMKIHLKQICVIRGTVKKTFVIIAL